MKSNKPNSASIWPISMYSNHAVQLVADDISDDPNHSTKSYILIGPKVTKFNFSRVLPSSYFPFIVSKWHWIGQ